MYSIIGRVVIWGLAAYGAYTIANNQYKKNAKYEEALEKAAKVKGNEDA